MQDTGEPNGAGPTPPTAPGSRRGTRRTQIALPWRSARTARGRSQHDRCGVGADVPKCSGRAGRERESRCQSFRKHARLAPIGSVCRSACATSANLLPDSAPTRALKSIARRTASAHSSSCSAPSSVGVVAVTAPAAGVVDQAAHRPEHLGGVAMAPQEPGVRIRLEQGVQGEHVHRCLQVPQPRRAVPLQEPEHRAVVLVRSSHVAVGHPRHVRRHPRANRRNGRCGSSCP